MKLEHVNNECNPNSEYVLCYDTLTRFVVLMSRDEYLFIDPNKEHLACLCDLDTDDCIGQECVVSKKNGAIVGAGYASLKDYTDYTVNKEKYEDEYSRISMLSIRGYNEWLADREEMISKAKQLVDFHYNRLYESANK